MKNVVAIDIGSRAIKVIEGYRRKGSFVMRRIGMTENPVRDFRGAITTDAVQKDLSLCIRRYLHTLDIEATEAYCSVSGRDVVIHYFSVPDLPEQELREAVRLEMLQVIPGGLDDLEYDYTLLSSSGKKTVLFVGFSREKTASFISILTAAGLRPLVMDVDGLAAGNCRQYLQRAEDLTFVINVGAIHTNVYIAERNGFVFIRDIEFGAETVPASVSNRIQNGGDEQAELDGVVEESSHAMLDEVVTAYRYFESQTGKKPSSFSLLGGGSLLPGLCSILEGILDIHGELWNPFANIPEVAIPDDMQGKGRFFGVALGLLTRGGL